jgi:hypothetical protein
MEARDEQQLRTASSAMVLDWVSDFSGSSKEQFALAITAAHVVADESRHSVQRWIDGGRRAGMSWSEIGAALGISRQAAQQRFGSVDDLEAASEGEIVVSGATAVNEVRLLREEGTKGHELVRTAFLRLVFRATNHPWEHARVVAVNPQHAAAQLGQESWQYVSSWFPFHYFKRPLRAL